VPPEVVRSLEQAARSQIVRVQAAAAQMNAEVARPADSKLTASLHAAVDELRTLLESELEPVLHRAHWLVQDVLASLMCAARALDDPGQLARCALRLIQAREEVLPLGTPQLANMYNAYGSALAKLLRSERVPSGKRPEAAAQAVAALEAACKIRACCFGDDHPLTKATGAAHDRAVEQQQRWQQQPSPPKL